MRARCGIVVGMWALALAASARARAEEPDAPRQLAASRSAQELLVAPQSGDAITASLLDGIDARWLRRRLLVNRGDRQGAALAARDLVDQVRDERIGRLPQLARAALFEGKSQEQQRDFAAAAETYVLARTLDPHLAVAYWREAAARRSAGEGLAATAPLAVRSVLVRWSAFWPRYRDVVAFGVLVLGALLAAGAAAVVTLVLRHAPVVAHEVEERMPATWSGASRRVAAWAVVLAPVAVQFLGAFGLVIWSVLLVPAGTRGERRLVYAWLVVLALAVPAAGALWSLAALPASPTARAALAGAEAALDQRLVQELDGIAAARPGEATWKVLTARLVGPREPERAMQLLREAAQADPQDARIQIELGNIFFRMGKSETAAVYYRQAADSDKQNVLALYNLSRARAALLDARMADEALQQARAVSADEVRRLERRAIADGVADPVFPVREIARRVVDGEALPSARQAVEVLNPVSLVALAALVGALLIGLRDRSYGARRCTRCGRGFCGRCVGVDRNAEICTACTQLFTRREGLAPAARQAQARLIDRRIRLLAHGRRVAQAVWPGLALMHEGRTWFGAAQAVTWAFLLQGALLTSRLLPPGEPVGPWSPGLPFAVLAVLFWAAAQLPAMRPQAAGRRGGR